MDAPSDTAASSAPARTFAVFAGGGTGGHVVPGLVVARELVERGHAPDSLRWVGSSRGIETTLVPEAGFDLVTLPGRGVQRRLTLANVAAIAGIVVAVFRGIGIIRRLRPRVVLALGGYASLPCVVGAIIWRVPIVVLARDARAGAADKVAGRFAKACAVPFAQTDLPRAVVTGNPVRAEVLAVDRETDRLPAREKLDLPADRVVVAVFTGSLGSRRVNSAVSGLVERWSDRADVAIRHVFGSRDWDDVRPDRAAAVERALTYQTVRYEDHMELLLAAADVVVSRAGGATVAELSIVGLPSILVPLPIATRDHQTANAQVLVDVDAAVCVVDEELDTDRLERELAPLVADADRREGMGRRARALGHPDAAARVASLVEEHAKAP